MHPESLLAPPPNNTKKHMAFMSHQVRGCRCIAILVQGPPARCLVLVGMPATARPCAHFEVAGRTVLVAVAGGDAETVAAVEEAVVLAMVGFGEAVRAAALGSDAPEPAAEDGQEPVAEPPPAVDAVRTVATQGSNIS